MRIRLVRDTWLFFRRYIGLTLRNPALILSGVLQPVYYLVLFAPLLQAVSRGAGFPRGGPFNVFVPGLLLQLGLFGTAFVGFGLIDEVRYGLVERLRVTPMSRLALLLGRALRDVLVLVLQSSVLVGLAIPLGLRVAPVSLLIALGLLVLIGLVMALSSYALALSIQDHDTLAPVLNTVAVPLLLLSGVLLPMSLAPGWLQTLSSLNPLSYAVTAGRALFNAQLGDPSIPKALAMLLAMTIVALFWASRSFSRAAR